MQLESKNTSVQYILKNFGVDPIFMLDGFGDIVKLHPDPAVNEHTNFNYSMGIPQAYLGHLIVEKYQTINDIITPINYTILTKIPKMNQGLSGWCYSVPSLNITLFGNEVTAQNFRTNEGSTFNYYVYNNVGMANKNAASIYIANITSRPLYKVDMFGITEIPNGPDMLLNLDGLKPEAGISEYIKIYQHCGLIKFADGTVNTKLGINYGSEIFEFKTDLGDDFLDIPQLNCILFTSEKAAKDFLLKFQDINQYRKYSMVEEFEESIEDIKKDITEEVNGRIKKYLIGVGSLLGFQFVGLMASMITNIVQSNTGKEKPAEAINAIKNIGNIMRKLFNK